MRSGAPFPEVRFNLVAGNGLHPATFQVVIAAVQHFARLLNFFEVTGESIEQNVSGTASALDREFVELFFNVGSELHFHVSSLRNNAPDGKHESHPFLQCEPDSKIDFFVTAGARLRVYLGVINPPSLSCSLEAWRGNRVE